MASQTRLHPKNVINSILVASRLSRISHILSLLARARWLWVSAPTKAIRAAATRHHFQALDFLAHGFVEDGVGKDDQPVVQGSPRGTGSQTLRIHHSSTDAAVF